MKQTIQFIALLVLFVAILGLSYFLYQHNQQSTLLLEQLQQNNAKQITDLNDRLVAVARQHSEASHASHALVAPAINPAYQQHNIQQAQLHELQQHWLLTALQLIQQQLNVSDYQQAQTLLLQLQHNVAADYRVQQAPLQATLLQTLKIDQLTIQQNASRQQQRQEQLDLTLAQLQQQLSKLAVEQPAATLPAQSSSLPPTVWWQRLLLIEPTRPEIARHQLDRSFIYKQTSLNLALARLALLQHNQLDFNRYVNEAVRQLELLTDRQSRQLLQALHQVASQPLPERIQLTSLTLLAGAKSSALPRAAP